MSGSGTQGPKRVTVQILHNPGNAPSVDQDSVDIWAPQGDEVEWLCNAAGKEFHVRFPDKSPFQQDHYHSKNNRSGRVKPGASGRYKYTVEIDGKILDPTVIVHPP